jgi:hypothetical protein
MEISVLWSKKTLNIAETLLYSQPSCSIMKTTADYFLLPYWKMSARSLSLYLSLSFSSFPHLLKTGLSCVPAAPFRVNNPIFYLFLAMWWVTDFDAFHLSSCVWF